MVVIGNKFKVTTQTGSASIDMRDISALVVQNFLVTLREDENKEVSKINIHMKSGTIFITKLMTRNEIDLIEDSWLKHTDDNKEVQ
tara:strand:+ start:9935 stop:10192 length:258 start_codon:yes stop_codon:yes gene_type:complete